MVRLKNRDRYVRLFFREWGPCRCPPILMVQEMLFPPLQVFSATCQCLHQCPAFLAKNSTAAPALCCAPWLCSWCNRVKVSPWTMDRSGTTHPPFPEDNCFNNAKVDLESSCFAPQSKLNFLSTIHHDVFWEGISLLQSTDVERRMKGKNGHHRLNCRWQARRWS